MNAKSGKLFLLSAPTGTGKTTVVTKVLDQIGSRLNLKRVITYTSRAQRPGEIDGKDYFFIAEQDFIAKREQGFFLETNTYDNHWYGSPASIIDDLSNGTSYLIITDRLGAIHITQKIQSAVLIWLTVSDFSMIEKRLHTRTFSTTNEQKERIMIAQAEWYTEYQAPLFTYHISNDDGRLESCVTKVCMVIEAELKKNLTNSNLSTSG